MPSMTILAMATPSISKRARSAPKMRSALSALLPQSNGNAPVTILISRRFSSAIAVRRDASHHQAAMMTAKAPTSAAPLNAPRSAALQTSMRCRFTIRSTAGPHDQLGCHWPRSIATISSGGNAKRRKTEDPRPAHLAPMTPDHNPPPEAGSFLRR